MSPRKRHSGRTLPITQRRGDGFNDRAPDRRVGAWVCYASCVMNGLPSMDEIRKTWQEPITTVVVSATIHTGCSKCFGTGSVYVQVLRGNGGWTQMWIVCDLCRGKGHA
jgi:hypothetical protein